MTNGSKTTKEFIDDAIKVHGVYYDYSNTDYTNNCTKVTIIDPIFGPFLHTPNLHLSGTKGGIASAVNKNDWFAKKARLIYGDYYDYRLVEYKSSETKVKIIHPIYGVFYQTPTYHLQGREGSLCSAINKTEWFINQAKEVHGDRYDYLMTDYINSRHKVKIVCPIHGEFEQSPVHHLQGMGCKQCSKELHGWTYTKWEKAGLKSKNFDSFKVYIIRCWDEEEEFYKIGKTFLGVSGRFNSRNKLPYKYEIAEVIKGSAREISELEIHLQNENKEYKYTPKIKFRGMYECYTSYTMTGYNKNFGSDEA